MAATLVRATLSLPCTDGQRASVSVGLPAFTWAALAERAERRGLHMQDAVARAVRAWAQAGAPPPAALPRELARASPEDQVLNHAITWWLNRPGHRAHARA